MGITTFSARMIAEFANKRKIESVCDLGAQNYYKDGEPLPAPYFSDWWKARDENIKYLSIDLNGENGSEKWDLSKPLPTNMKFDLVTDFGTTEHVGNQLRDAYECFKNVHNLCKVGGLMIHENPKTGHWPLHGFHFFTQGFYIDLAARAGYIILSIGESIAGGNEETGKNVYCVMQKEREEFIPFELFPETLIK